MFVEELGEFDGVVGLVWGGYVSGGWGGCE